MIGYLFIDTKGYRGKSSLELKNADYIAQLDIKIGDTLNLKGISSFTVTDFYVGYNIVSLSVE